MRAPPRRGRCTARSPATSFRVAWLPPRAKSTHDREARSNRRPRIARGRCRFPDPAGLGYAAGMGAQWKTKLKAEAGAAKGRIFTKLTKEIMIAAKGGADPSMNAK